MNIRKKAATQPASPLTAAEKRVLALVSMAKTNKEIARALGISPSTVKRHLENVLKKLRLKNRIEVAIYGLSVKGCPQGIASHCPLKTWHIEKEKSAGFEPMTDRQNQPVDVSWTMWPVGQSPNAIKE